MKNKHQSSFSELKASLPTLGIGLGLRGSLVDSIMAFKEKIDWLEFTPENYFQSATGGQDLLQSLGQHFALTSHGVSLSIGSADPLNPDYLTNLKHLVQITNSPWFSDHLSFSSVDNHYIHDLFPLPQNSLTAQHIADKIQAAQAFVGKPMLIENISAYQKMDGPLSESQFLTEVATTADCGILLDLNNLYINSINLKFDPYQFLAEIPLERVVQVHMAGHLQTSKYLVDSHGERVEKNVFALLEHLLTLIEVNAITLERDQNFADFNELIYDLDHIRDIHKNRKPLAVSAVKNDSAASAINCTPTGEGVAALREFEKAFIGNLLEKATGASPFKINQQAIASHDLANLQLSENANEIYSMITNSRLDELLQSVYPITFAALGNNSKKVSAAFYRQYPTVGFSHQNAAKDFSNYIKSEWQMLIADLPYLAQLAEIEFKQHFCAEFNKEMQVVHLELDSFEQLSQFRPVLNESLDLIKSSYPLPSIVRAVASVANMAADQGHSSSLSFDVPWTTAATGISAPYSLVIYRPTSGASAQLFTIPTAAATLIDTASKASKKSASCLNLIEETMTALKLTPSPANLASLIGLTKELFELGIFVGCVAV
ncbi:hypothetical protein BH11CYA1_BH11CYA1_14860 [soil metagenome]